MLKKRVILTQLGWPYSDEYYLPLSSGMLAAMCKVDSTFNEYYEIDPWLRFARDDPQKIVDGFEVPPDILGLSCYVWCEQISLEVARLTKERFPTCLVVFGGPSVTDHYYAKTLLRAQPYVDVIVHGEGEQTFLDLCLSHARRPYREQVPVDRDAREYKKDMIPGTALVSSGHYLAAPARAREKNLDRFPSPFLDGTFDRLLQQPAAKEVKFAAIWEPDRGCLARLPALSVSTGTRLFRSRIALFVPQRKNTARSVSRARMA